MYCENCKKEIENDNIYCPKCGNKLEQSENSKKSNKKIIIFIISIIICLLLYVFIYNSKLNKARRLFDEKEYYEAKQSVEYLFPTSNEIKKIKVYGKLMSSYSLAETEYSLGNTQIKAGKDDDGKETLKDSLRNFLIGLQIIDEFLEDEHSQFEYEIAKSIQQDYYKALDAYFLIDEDKANELKNLGYDEMKKEVSNYIIVLDAFINLLKE